MDKKLIFLLIISCKVVASSQEIGGPFGIGSSNRQSTSLSTSHLCDPRQTFGAHALEQHTFRPLMHQQSAPAYCYPLLLMNNVNNTVPFPVMMPQQQLVGANLDGVQYPYPFPNIPMFWMPAQNTNFHSTVNHQILQHPLSQLHGFSASKHSQDQTRTSLHDGPPPLIYYDQLRDDYKAPKNSLDHSDGGVRKSIPRRRRCPSKSLSLTHENSVSDQQLKNAQDKGNALLHTDISSLGDFSTDGEGLNLSMASQGGQLMEEATADHSVPNNQKAHATSHLVQHMLCSSSSSNTISSGTDSEKKLSAVQIEYLKKSALMKHDFIKNFVTNYKPISAIIDSEKTIDVENLDNSKKFEALYQVYAEINKNPVLQPRFVLPTQLSSSKHVKPSIISLETFKGYYSRPHSRPQYLILKILSDPLFFYFFHQYPYCMEEWKKFYCEEDNLFLTLEKGKDCGKEEFGSAKIKLLFDNHGEENSLNPFFKDFLRRISVLKGVACGSRARLKREQAEFRIEQSKARANSLSLETTGPE